MGIVTDRDITVRAVAEGRGPVTTQVREVMTPDAIYGFDDQDVEDAARLMEQYQIRRLPVLNRRKRLVGMVSLGDLAVHPGQQPLAGEMLEQVSEPGTSSGHSQEPLACVSAAQDLLSRCCRVMAHADWRPTVPRVVRPLPLIRFAAGGL